MTSARPSTSATRPVPTGYLVTFRTTAVEGDAAAYGHPVGSTLRSGWSCRAGVCTGTADDGVPVSFRAGASRVHQVRTFISKPSAATTDMPCWHTTTTLDLVRQADGRYTGTFRYHPGAVTATVGNEICSAAGWTETVTGVPS